MPVREGDGDERPHRVPHHDAGTHAEVRDDGREIVGVRRHAGGPVDAVAPPASAEVGGDETDAREVRGGVGPREVRRRDPVDEDDRGGVGIFGSPDPDGERAAADGDLDGPVGDRVCAAVGADHRAVHPPSMARLAPVIMPAASVASQPASEATSSGATRRLTADSVSMIFSTTSPSGMPWIRA